MNNLIELIRRAPRPHPRGFRDSGYGKRPAEAGPKESVEITLTPVGKKQTRTTK